MNRDDTEDNSSPPRTHHTSSCVTDVAVTKLVAARADSDVLLLHNKTLGSYHQNNDIFCRDTSCPPKDFGRAEKRVGAREGGGGGQTVARN